MSHVPAPENFWEERSRRYGRRAVLDLRRTDAEYETLSQEQWGRILPHLTRSLDGSEKLAVDFGCGAGRLTALLARTIGGRAVGVDPTANLLALAPSSADTRFEPLTLGRCTLPDGVADLVFIYVVLGGLRDEILQAAVDEIRRLLRPGGLLFLVESTSDHPDAPHWTYRNVSTYQCLLDFAPLSHLCDYEELGERMTLMAGRRAPEFPNTPAIL
jgi:SAM-dependent methyltransferase